MSALSPPLLDHEVIYRGASFHPQLTLVYNGAPKDLTSATIRWQLFDLSEAAQLTEKTVGSGVSFGNSDPATGVTIAANTSNETESLVPGDYWQEWHITDSVGDTQVYRGRVTVAHAKLWEV
jgi:hypothetical protein